MNMQKSVIFAKKNLTINMRKIKNYSKVRAHCHHTGKYRGAAHSTCNLNFSVPKTISIAFHSQSNYVYHFIIKILAEEFKENLLV